MFKIRIGMQFSAFLLRVYKREKNEEELDFVIDVSLTC